MGALEQKFLERLYLTIFCCLSKGEGAYVGKEESDRVQAQCGIPVDVYVDRPGALLDKLTERPGQRSVSRSRGSDLICSLSFLCWKPCS